MSDSIKDCKDVKCELETQIAKTLSDFCTKYGVTLKKIAALQKPNYQAGDTYWSGEIELSVTL